MDTAQLAPDLLHSPCLPGNLLVDAFQDLLRNLLLLGHTLFLQVSAYSGGGQVCHDSILVGKVFLHRFNFLREQIKPLFQGHVNVGSRLFHLNAQPVQTVIQHDIGDYQQDYQYRNPNHQVAVHKHMSSLFMVALSVI